MRPQNRVVVERFLYSSIFVSFVRTILTCDQAFFFFKGGRGERKKKTLPVRDIKG